MSTIPRRTATGPTILLGLSLLWGCADDPGLTAPTGADLGGSTSEAGHTLSVMTRNVFLGGETAALLTIDFNDLPAVLAAVNGFWAEVQASDFPDRAATLADEVGRYRPHVIGLQEVVRYRILDGAFQALSQLDMLAHLQAALAAGGLSYTTVVVQENTDAALPLSVSATGVDRWLQFTDRVALLVRSDVVLEGPPSGGIYAATFTVGPVELERGWVHTRVRHGGRAYDLVNTHLEGQALAPVQALQVAELLGSILPTLDATTVLMGDLNSDAAAGPGAPSWTPTYATLTAAGFVDAWVQAHPGATGGGLTCCHDPDLRNAVSVLDERIDFILIESGGPGVDWRIPGSIAAEVVGEEPADRTAGGLWPSDHAGLVALLRPAPGIAAF